MALARPCFAPRLSEANIRLNSKLDLKTRMVMEAESVGCSKISKISFTGTVSEVFHLLASLNSCANPWVYMGFSGHLLDELKRFFLCRKKVKFHRFQTRKILDYYLEEWMKLRVPDVLAYLSFGNASSESEAKCSVTPTIASMAVASIHASIHTVLHSASVF